MGKTKTESPKTRVSKALSYYLRHHLESLHCPVATDGYVPLAAVLTKREFRGVSIAEVEEIVRTCPKQRFSLKKGPRWSPPSSTGAAPPSEGASEEEYYIRANQGHSLPSASRFDLKADDLYELIEEPLSFCAHGTTASVLPLIQTEGLKKMNRTHIHLIATPDARSGYRRSSDVLIHIDMAAAMRDGIQFYRSANGVVLSEGIDGVIDPKYIQQVELLR